ncbi:unnamed protein product (macronuclear) [Paramecium tetraurelia]|uniref:Uncharacterized protein n=1 Tax=Paramecium tetraurelia TaxID=5888 RepID=A0BPR3_PARTE|nr:uncharacterized protein GSPATT00005280001 [Paramecium tetraurelia]CAK60530.1 unnamed protein product [Paramecium tetraurelia]|eukprot:XP_001427928.1 hypothetical protein (macronuclear) [Paramecium tetraurelia strain d4-2]
MEVPQVSRTRLSSKKLSEGVRIDKKGHPILKGYKMHQVTFIDEIIKEKKIHQIILVDCWKEHNFNKYDNENQKCCLIS